MIAFPKPIRLKPKRSGKYNAVKQTYNGYSYQSRAEARYAFSLDIRLKAKEDTPFTNEPIRRDK